MFFRYVKFAENILNQYNNIPFLFFNGIFISSHLGYSFLTIEEKEIVVKNKYQEINYGFIVFQ
jgi:hypothetical protein